MWTIQKYDASVKNILTLVSFKEHMLEILRFHVTNLKTCNLPTDILVIISIATKSIVALQDFFTLFFIYFIVLFYSLFFQYFEKQLIICVITVTVSWGYHHYCVSTALKLLKFSALFCDFSDGKIIYYIRIR